jgi:AcrR family transcriptional regulator
MDAIETLPRSQAARRQRVVQAALKLAAEGGYDAVQMREVGTEAGVALGTIYRYFSSKDDLLAAVLVAWVEDLEGRVTQRPPTGELTSERVASVLRRAHRAMEKQPKLAEAVITAMVSPDPATIGSKDQTGQAMARVLARAMSEDLDPEMAANVTRVLTHVWFSALISWINGRGEIGSVGDDVEIACHLMLDQFDHG